MEGRGSRTRQRRQRRRKILFLVLANVSGIEHSFEKRRACKLDYRAAPPGWGSPVVRVWTLSRTQHGGTLFPDETGYDEGRQTRVTVNRYERDPAARQKCIEYYGLDCTVCGLNFEREYGPEGAGFIHVHHIVEVSKGGRRKIDPIRDLRPICPNCHGIIHYNSPMLSIEQLRNLRKRRRRK